MITLNDLKTHYDNSFDISGTIDWALDQNLPYPKPSKKPFLEKTHSVEQLEDYTKQFNLYTNQKSDCDEKLLIYKNKIIEIDSAIVEFIKKESDFYKHVPKNKQEKVWNKAWDVGHSYGFYSVYQELGDLVELFMD